MSENLFVSKTACLLHDPPNKAWLLRYHKDHREEARRIAIDVLENTCLKGAIARMEEISKPADMLASSMDRWLLNKIVSEDYHLFPVSEIKLKNIFNPKFSWEVEQKQPSTNEFIRALKRVIEPITEPRLAYHVLYAIYEPLWMQLGLPSGPADTRAPSHTVFDHVYATSSAMNWLLDKDKPSGILLFIDLGGPQRFISSSRKLSDLWLSSYLASALAWSVFWIFVKTLGPDVMILPTCRGNPFYYHSLISDLINNRVNGDIIKEIKEVSNRTAGYDPDKDKVPRHAVIPVAATFILPEIEHLKEYDEFKELDSKELESLEEFVKKKYQEIWRSIYDEVIETLGKVIELENLATEARRLLKECKIFRFDITPPLPIRVVALHTRRLYELGFREEEQFRLYHYMFKLLAYEEGARKLYKFRPEEHLELYGMTSQPIESWPKKSSRGFEYCSLCGRLPAIIVLPSNEKEYENYLDIKLEPIFSLGERLCPYCLIKRLLAIKEIFKPVIDKLLGKTSDDLPIRRFIPVCDISLMPFKRSLIEKGKVLDSIPELADMLSKRMDRLLIDLRQFKQGCVEDFARGEEPILDAEEDLLRKIENIKSSQLKTNLKYLLFLNTEASIMSDPTRRRIWSRLIKELNENKRMKIYGEEIADLNAYYAIIRCDGDNLNKIIQGNIEDAFRVKIKDYVCNMLEGPAVEFLKAIVNKEVEGSLKICGDQNIKEPSRKVNEISKFIDDLQEKKEIIISPSYHASLSRALMNNAVRDTKIIGEHDGLTIYAGGDDILAVTPVTRCLEATQKLREKFSFPSEIKGFDKIGNYLIPSLATASRSFSIFLTHYMYPMYAAIIRSAGLLDEIAKKAEWVAEPMKIEPMKKNTLVISYSPRGSEINALLPLSDVKDPEEALAKFLRYLNELTYDIEKYENGFSTSLIYDLHNNLQTINLLIDRNSEDLLKKLLYRIFEKNCEAHYKSQCKVMAEKWVTRLMENYNVSVNMCGRSNSLLGQLFLALMLYRSSLKGAE